jgi:hypothetical protein
MISTLVGVGCGDAQYGHAHQVAAFFDFAGFVTMVVLAVLTIAEVGSLPIGYSAAQLLCVGGILGLTLLALRYIRPPPKHTVTMKAQYE